MILPALGSAIVFDIGASTGGTDILAMILKRRTTLEIGRALLLVDIGIVTIAAFLYGPRVGLYCVLGLFAKTLVVDKAIESIHLRKVCTVICSEPLKVEEFIVKHLNRTATISRGYGAFSGKCVTVIMSVLSRREACNCAAMRAKSIRVPLSRLSTAPRSSARVSAERTNAVELIKQSNSALRIANASCWSICPHIG